MNQIAYLQPSPGGVDKIYSTVCSELLREGLSVETRGHRCRRLVAVSVVFRETPLVSVRKTAWKNSLREWEWFMSGSSDIDDLHPSVRHWWQPWAVKEVIGQWQGADVVSSGPEEVRYNYSKQFRRFQGGAGNGTWPEEIDQIEYLIDGIKNHPFGRRNVITTWNTAEMVSPDCPITNCHGTVIQAAVDAQDRLLLVTYQRSADFVCGVPHNWFQYWAFMVWLAHRTGRKPGLLHWIGGDVHLYEGHVELAQKIVARADEAGPTPQLVYAPTSDDFKADDFTLDREYVPVLTDKAEMFV